MRRDVFSTVAIVTTVSLWQWATVWMRSCLDQQQVFYSKLEQMLVIGELLVNRRWLLLVT